MAATGTYLWSQDAGTTGDRGRALYQNYPDMYTFKVSVAFGK